MRLTERFDLGTDDPQVARRIDAGENGTATYNCNTCDVAIETGGLEKHNEWHNQNDHQGEPAPEEPAPPTAA